MSPFPDPLEIQGLDLVTARLAAWYEQLSVESLSQLGLYYAPEVRFKDPFHEVRGVEALQAIYAAMFKNLVRPSFTVSGQVVQGRQAFLIWELHFYFQRWRAGEEQCVRGVSHLQFDERGLVIMHRDYWDAAEELYAKVPGLGRVIRWLQKRVAQ